MFRPFTVNYCKLMTHIYTALQKKRVQQNFVNITSKLRHASTSLPYSEKQQCLVSSVSSSGSLASVKSSLNAVVESSYLSIRYVCPVSLEALLKLVKRFRRCFFRRETPAKHVPDMFDDVEVRRSSRPWQKVYIFFLKAAHCNGCGVWSGIVLLEEHALFMVTHKWDNMWAYNVIHTSLSRYVASESNQFSFARDRYGPPYH